MSAFATALGILLVVLAIPFGLMLAPLALGIVVIVVGWRHVSADFGAPSPEALA